MKLLKLLHSLSPKTDFDKNSRLAMIHACWNLKIGIFQLLIIKRCYDLWLWQQIIQVQCLSGNALETYWFLMTIIFISHFRFCFTWPYERTPSSFYGGLLWRRAWRIGLHNKPSRLTVSFSSQTPHSRAGWK